VVANCCEGDPTSAKDEVLLDRSPHLVIDGALTAAAAVGADRIVLAGHAGSSVLRTLPVALSQRPASAVTVEPVAVPARYLASEATALVRFLNTGDARPAGRLSPVWRKGVDGRPTLVANAETLAQLALLARFGPDWFAALGSPTEPGTVLVTVGGAVPRPGVVEVPTGTALCDVLACAGAPPTGWALVGGLAGGWVDLARCAGVGFDTESLRAVGASRGVGSITVLPPGACLLAETARIAAHQAQAGARQCGPCMFGLPAIAADLSALAAGDRSALGRLHRRLPIVNGRGACGHPDGTVALAAGALATVTARQRGHLDRHLPTVGSRPPGADADLRPHRVDERAAVVRARVLRVDPIACRAHGLCADELPEAITLDEWGYPILPAGPVPAKLVRRARAAAAACPVLALRLAAGTD